MFDSPSDIERKIAKAVTDTDGEVRYDWEKKPGLSNLLEIYASLSGESPQDVAERYSRYGELKNDLAARLINERSRRRGRATTSSWRRPTTSTRSRRAARRRPPSSPVRSTAARRAPWASAESSRSHHVSRS